MKYLRLVLFMALAWWPMLAVHEMGHVLGSSLSGARVERVILWPPWVISQTVRGGSHAPMVDTWAGPLAGMLVPLVAYGFVCAAKRACWRRVVGFFAGFCMLTNGVYLGLGWMDRAGDAGDLRRLGVPVAVLACVGALAVVLGLLLWHRESFPGDGRRLS